MEVRNRRKLLDSFLSALMREDRSSVCSDRDGTGDN